MLTFFDGASSAPMTYYANEKKNGISPKIAGQGRRGGERPGESDLRSDISEVSVADTRDVCWGRGDVADGRQYGDA